MFKQLNFIIMSLVLSISFFIAFLLFGIRGVINLFISLAIYSCAAYYLCDINPEETYSWYSGIWHGLFFIPNCIFHDIRADALYKANFYTTAYNVWWWIFTIFSVLGFILKNILGDGR